LRALAGFEAAAMPPEEITEAAAPTPSAFVKVRLLIIARVLQLDS
jgi:hypothetical protein